ncbi:unnamed protein product [marine sediment metagenome]|uniref:Uncharacterized protein n=1 Tax=marine sediment metagenome TaxID=412755 RepID=X1J1H5_9ZZZZ
MPELNYILGDTYSSSWKGKPPHMLPVDVPVWHDFLDKYGDAYLHFYYDVALSTKPKPPDLPVGAMLTMWKKSFGKRIDAVGEMRNTVHIIEVTEQAFLRSLGQILVYAELWRVDPPIKKPFLPYIVCRTIDEDVLWTCQAYGVNHHLV